MKQLQTTTIALDKITLEYLSGIDYGKKPVLMVHNMAFQADSGCLALFGFGRQFTTLLLLFSP